MQQKNRPHPAVRLHSLPEGSTTKGQNPQAFLKLTIVNYGTPKTQHGIASFSATLGTLKLYTQLWQALMVSHVPQEVVFEKPNSEEDSNDGATNDVRALLWCHRRPNKQVF